MKLDWMIGTASFDKHGHAMVSGGTGWGVIDRQGKVIIPPEWFFIESVDADGNARVVNDEGDMGYVEAGGKVVVKPELRYLSEFDETGMAWAESKDKCGLLDRNGKVRFMIDGRCRDFAVKVPYDKNGLALICDSWRLFWDKGLSSDRDIGWVDRDGKYVIKITDGWPPCISLAMVAGLAYTP